MQLKIQTNLKELNGKTTLSEICKSKNVKDEQSRRLGGMSPPPKRRLDLEISTLRNAP